MNENTDFNIYTDDIEELYQRYLIVLEEENEETGQPNTEVYKAINDKIKNGFRIKCRINYLFPSKRCLQEYPSNRKAIILGHGKYNLEDVEEEIEQRKTQMRKIIIENQPSETNTLPRTQQKTKTRGNE